jgi:Flp pilus assembly pilin Flp
MKSVLKKFWNDEAGFVVTVEMILVATVLVIGLVAGLTVLRDAVLSELSDTAQAFGAIDQSYSVSAANYDSSSSSSQFGFKDAPDVIDGVNQGIGLPVVAGLNVVPSTVYTDGTASQDNP